MRLGENITNTQIIGNFGKLPEKFFNKFGTKFDYSRVVFTGMKDNITIICKDHGEFIQTPQMHLSSKFGCPKCATSSKIIPNRRSQESFIKDIDRVQNGNYDLSNINFKGKFDYNLVDYTGNKNRVQIICPTHGVFDQNAQQHLQHGCDKCARDLSAIERYKDTPTKFYSFKYNGLYKIGVTTKETVKQRYEREQIVWDNVSELVEVQFDGFVDAYMLEQFLLNEYVKYKYQGNTIFKYTKNTEVFTEDIYQIYLKETLE